MNLYKLFFTIILSSIFSSCGKPLSPEAKLKKFNEENGPHIQKDMQGNIYLRLPEQSKFVKTRTGVNRATLSLPYDVRPELSALKKSEEVYVHFKLDNLTAWDIPPPIPHDVAENVRIYSSGKKLLGQAPETVQDPEVRHRLYESMKYKRANKRVRFMLYEKTFSTYSELKEDALYYRSGYIPDGVVSGLQRFLKQYCYSRAQLMPSEHNPSDKRYLSRVRNLENKARDDPSPENCVVNRLNSILISLPSTPKSDWVHIECRPVLQECTATFEAAYRLIEVEIWYKDIKLWRETVDPIRGNINSYMSMAHANKSKYSDGVRAPGA